MDEAAVAARWENAREAVTRVGFRKKEAQKAAGTADMDGRRFDRPGARMAPRSGGQGSGWERPETEGCRLKDEEERSNKPPHPATAVVEGPGVFGGPGRAEPVAAGRKPDAGRGGSAVAVFGGGGATTAGRSEGMDARRGQMSLDGEFRQNEAASKREPACKAAAERRPSSAVAQSVPRVRR